MKRDGHAGIAYLPDGLGALIVTEIEKVPLPARDPLTGLERDGALAQTIVPIFSKAGLHVRVGEFKRTATVPKQKVAPR